MVNMKLALTLCLLAANAFAEPLIYLAGVTWNNPDGSRAIAVVARQNQSALSQTPVWKTTLYYSFCLVPVNRCFTGYGTIPNAAFTGTVSQSYTKADVLKLALDTSTVPGYVNAICYQPDADANCTGGEYLTTGGWIGLQFTKTPYIANVDSTTSTAIQYSQKEVATHSDGSYSSNCAGSVLGYDVSAFDFYQTKVSYSAGSYTVSGALAKFLPQSTVNQIRTLEKKAAR